MKTTQRAWRIHMVRIWSLRVAVTLLASTVVWMGLRFQCDGERIPAAMQTWPGMLPDAGLWRVMG